MIQPRIPVIISSLLALCSASSFAATVPTDTPLSKEHGMESVCRC
ncbi:hypothetical protein ACMAZD_20065 [Vibrio sp. nBUS_14]